MKRKAPRIIVIVVVVAAVIWFAAARHAREIVLTGMVTTDEVIVSSEIQGRLQELLVRQGDIVTNGQLLALIYTEIRAPTNGIVDTRAALQGEGRQSRPGHRHAHQSRTIFGCAPTWRRLTLTGIHLGDKLQVRLPSGAVREGTVFYRGVDADYATQRDVSRTKRDIKTFEIRLRCDNDDRSLAVGMTATSRCRCRICRSRGNEANRDLTSSPTKQNMFAVEVENLTKRFGDFVAVDALNFSVEHGEIFGLLGPNGAGKSTLIRMLTTLVPPTSGTARVNGFDIVREANDVRQSIGVIPQAMTSDLDLSAQENMSIFAKLYGIPREKAAADIPQLLKEVDLTQWADKPVKMFSGGMRRRLEIARGLVHEPKIFFLDEPTTGLDPVSRVAVWEMLARLKRERDLTILVTTHYMDEADKLCDRIAIIDHGKLAALDSPLKLKASIPGKNILEVSFSRAAKLAGDVARPARRGGGEGR
jgi:ABC-2 type transport system ATP-binding protein